MKVPSTRRWMPREPRHARGAVKPGSKMVALGCGEMATVVTVSTHSVGITDGSLR